MMRLKKGRAAALTNGQVIGNDGDLAIRIGLAPLPQMRRQDENAGTAAHGAGGLPSVLPQVQIHLCDRFQGRKNGRGRNAGRLDAVQTERIGLYCVCRFSKKYEARIDREEERMKNSALVVIDLQNDITKNYREIIGKVNEAIDWAVQRELWVIYIQHNNGSAGTRTFKPGTRGAELVPELKIVSDHIFTKSKSNALTSETFAAFIRENWITDFYLAGADAAACIKSTCFNMAKGGYGVHVLSDCITSYDKKKLPEMLAYYESKGCSVVELQEIVK